MCKELCEQTEQGKALWDGYRAGTVGWKQVKDYHHARVLAEMVKAAAKREGVEMVVIMCPRLDDETDG